MGYVDDHLMPNERVVYRTTLHWIMFLGPALASLVLIGLPWLIAAWVKFRSSEFAVTDKRLIVKTGFIQRQTSEMLLQKVESISVDQTVMGRMLDFGTVTIRGTGGTPEVYARIRRPLELRRHAHFASTSETA